MLRHNVYGLFLQKKSKSIGKIDKSIQYAISFILVSHTQQYRCSHNKEKFRFQLYRSSNNDVLPISILPAALHSFWYLLDRTSILSYYIAVVFLAGNLILMLFTLCKQRTVVCKNFAIPLQLLVQIPFSKLLLLPLRVDVLLSA